MGNTTRKVDASLNTVRAESLKHIAVDRYGCLHDAPRRGCHRAPPPVLPPPNSGRRSIVLPATRAPQQRGGAATCGDRCSPAPPFHHGGCNNVAEGEQGGDGAGGEGQGGSLAEMEKFSFSVIT